MTASTQPVVVLQPVDDGVLAALLAVATAEADADEVTPPLGRGPGWTPERRDWFLAYHRRSREGLDGSAGEATWAVVLDGRPVGAVRLQRTDDPAVLVTGVWLARSTRGRAVGVDALRLVLQEAARVGATAVRADTAVGNSAARGALQRAGFALSAPGSDGRVHAQASVRPLPGR